MPVMPNLPPAPPFPGAIGHAVFDTLRSANASLERFAWLGDDMALALWHRVTTEEETAYLRPGHHTLSCYLGGGYRTERNDMPGVYGSPGRLCTLPDDHESHWMVRGELRLLHLYFLPRHFTRRAVVELDREPRELTLADRTYFKDAQLAGLCGALAGLPWDGADARLRLNETAHTALDRLLHVQAEPRRDQKLRGGLAPSVRRRLADYIEAHLEQPLTLGMLAEQACLSEYHLARMFRLSFGMPPYAWVAMRRIDRARHLLQGTTLPLQQVADRCGYADLSHFSHRFRAATGASPSRYRQLLGQSTLSPTTGKA